MRRIQTSGERAPRKRLLCDPWLRPRALRLVSGPRRRSGRTVIDRGKAYVLIVKGYRQGHEAVNLLCIKASDKRACSRRARKLVRVEIRQKEAGLKVTVLG